MPWLNLGTVDPSFLAWTLFNSPAIGSSEFRISFLGDIANVNSFIYLRSYYSNNEVSQSKRFYPTLEKQIFEFPTPIENDPAYATRYFGVRKMWKRKRFYGSARDSAWQVILEQYTPVEV